MQNDHYRKYQRQQDQNLHRVTEYQLPFQCLKEKGFTETLKQLRIACPLNS